PVAYVVGEREFWSLALTVTAATLTPRPETETLVEAVLRRVGGRERPLAVLDLGTGSGSLLLALLAELPAARGIGVDRSEAAVRVALGNAARLGIADRAAFVVGDWTRSIGGVFDVVVANPPYVANGDLDALAPEISRYEPRLALDGGADGLDAFRAIVPALADLVAEDGLAALEVGAGQVPAVQAMLARALPWEAAVETVDDLAGVTRCVLLKRRRPGKISLGNAANVG
ncbi:MAG: peptide chain release factor N(5)-glutamine methyltransferase, partial [Alphaproteobacteria bacterium]